jgi:hypothetical protein
VHQEIEHVREGKHGARSAKQVIAIGLSKARRAGVKLPAPRKGRTSAQSRAQAARDYRKGQGRSRRRPSPKRSRGVLGALKREGHEAASHTALSRQVHASARGVEVPVGAKQRKGRSAPKAAPAWPRPRARPLAPGTRTGDLCSG